MQRLEGDKTTFDISEELDVDFYDVLIYVSRFYDNGLIDKLSTTTEICSKD